MNDFDAIEAINAALNRYFLGEVTQAATLAAICTITGENAITHNEVKEAK